MNRARMRKRSRSICRRRAAALVRRRKAYLRIVRFAWLKGDISDCLAMISREWTEHLRPDDNADQVIGDIAGAVV